MVDVCVCVCVCVQSGLRAATNDQGAEVQQGVMVDVCLCCVCVCVCVCVSVCVCICHPTTVSTKMGCRFPIHNVSMCRVGQNHMYAPLYMTVHLVISQPKIPCTHRIYMVLANPKHVTSCASYHCAYIPQVAMIGVSSFSCAAINLPSYACKPTNKL